jgi:hypothetical protein
VAEGEAVEMVLELMELIELLENLVFLHARMLLFLGCEKTGTSGAVGDTFLYIKFFKIVLKSKHMALHQYPKLASRPRVSP